MKKMQLLVLLAIIGLFAGLSSLEAKPVKKGLYNYKGNDGMWHYVTIYEDDKTGARWSSEWIHGDGPHIYHPAELPSHPQNLDISKTENSNDGNGNISIGFPVAIDCQFKAIKPGILEIKVDNNVEVDIIKINDGTIVKSRVPVSGNSNFQPILLPTGMNMEMPYGLIVYENGVTKYMELFFFDGKLHNSKEIYSDPGYNPDDVPFAN